MKSPLSILSKRVLILGIVALLLLAMLILRWIANWGLVTVHVKDAPLGKVLASIARQGHVRVESSIDPNERVSMDVDMVTPAQAIDTLSIRTDSSWRVVYLAAKSKGDINAALITLRGSGKIEDWVTNYYPAPFTFGESNQTIDPRDLSLQIEGRDLDLPKLLDEAAQKSGVMTAFPKDWHPSPSRLPKTNKVRKLIPSLVSSARGKVLEFFYLTERKHRWERNGDTRMGSDQNSQDNQGSGSWSQINPLWLEKRQLAEIQMLPPSEQEEAKKRLVERKALLSEMKRLSPEERRAKWQQMMSNPDLFQQMQDRQMLRQARQTAEQRINRAVNYLNNKANVKAAQSH
jgi:hypothetical protein